MKIGNLVKAHIEGIFKHCEITDHSELDRLMDKSYSKKTFDINYPFCTSVESILTEDEVRYWKNRYPVQGTTVRVSSQWYDKSEPQFIQYLASNNIIAKEVVSLLSEDKQVSDDKQSRSSREIVGTEVTQLVMLKTYWYEIF